jgi:4-amino-4-deoxy-L-arabinose transferase-like glycosyltransferase
MAHRVFAFVAAVAVIVAIVRIAFTYRDTSQGFDETCHVAAAIELLDRHTYRLDPVHPPLARLAIGIPLYLAGERFPHLSADEVAYPNYNVVGNHILYDDGHYLRNLVLARVAMLPFLALASGLVFLWARREYGELAGLFAVLLFTTTPMVMAFSSLAYTDLVTATTQLAALFAFTYWLETQNFRSTLLLGGAIGLALMSKLTSFLFLGSAGTAILACRWWLERNSHAGRSKVSVKRLTAALALSIVVLWSGYGFSVGHVREGMGVAPEQMPSFQHFPAPVGKLAKTMIQQDWVIPAPAFWRGLATIWVLNKTSPPAYLLGHMRSGGWWYFFLAGLAFKTPLPFLILCAVGVLSLSTQLRDRKWSGLAPVVAVAAILIVTMPVKYNAGTRLC